MENINDIKIKLIQRIIKIDDLQILLKLQEYILDFKNTQNDNLVKENTAIYQSRINFTEEQIKILEEAEKDIENGNFSTDEEVKKITEEWLK